MMTQQCFALGTYTSLGGPGIRVFSIQNGRFTVLFDTWIEDPIWLEMAPDGKHLYAACGGEGPQEGFIASFAPDGPDFSAGLREEARQTARGVCPCHLCVCGGDLISANYASGSISVFPLTQGVPGPLKQYIQHTGSGTVLARQAGPHVHQVLPLDQNRFQAVDLGTDRLIRYHKSAGQWEAYSEISVSAGDGPRHAAVRWEMTYIVTELSSRLLVLRGTEPAEAWALPEENRTCDNAPAALRFDGSGQYLYVSCRGADCIAVFRLLRDGLLRREGILPVYGQWPRDLYPVDRNTLICANQKSGLTLLHRERDVFRLQDSMPVPGPVSILPL